MLHSFHCRKKSKTLSNNRKHNFYANLYKMDSSVFWSINYFVLQQIKYIYLSFDFIFLFICEKFASNVVWFPVHISIVVQAPRMLPRTVPQTFIASVIRICSAGIFVHCAYLNHMGHPLQTNYTFLKFPLRVRTTLSGIHCTTAVQEYQ